jgi:hypothetical protein
VTAEIIDMRGYDPLRHNITGLGFLHQNRAWLDRDGVEHELAAMPTSYLRNVLAFLRRHAASLELHDAMCVLSGPFAPRGEMAQEDVGAMFDERALTPDAWLETTELVTRLRELLVERAAAGPPADTEPL